MTVSHSKQAKVFYGFDFMATQGLTFLTNAPHFPHMYHSVTLWLFCWFFMRIREINNRLRLQLNSEAYPEHGRRSMMDFLWKYFMCSILKLFSQEAPSKKFGWDTSLKQFLTVTWKYVYNSFNGNLCSDSDILTYHKYVWSTVQMFCNGSYFLLLVSSTYLDN